jgi:hypothetical protein
MNYPAPQGIAIVQSHWSDHTPRGYTAEQPFTPDSCTGYTEDAMRQLNAEFDQRWNAGDWEEMGGDEAIKAFQHEVSGRR